MNEKALWPAIWGVGIVCGMATALLIAGIDVASVIALFSIIANFILIFMGLMLYGKVTKIETNTNGTMTQMHETNRDLIETVKLSPPVEK